jgi:hypothetical protein
VWLIIVAFVIGVFVGATLGVLAAALAWAARRDDETGRDPD